MKKLKIGFEILSALSILALTISGFVMLIQHHPILAIVYGGLMLPNLIIKLKTKNKTMQQND
jgi:hypothetical protein